MEADVKFMTNNFSSFATTKSDLTTSQQQVLFHDEPTEIGGVEKGDDTEIEIGSNSSEVSSIQVFDPPILKSTAKGVQRSRDYAQQLELIIHHFSSNKDFGQLSDEENQPYLVLQEIASIVKMLEQDRVKIKGDIERERKMVVRLQERLDEFVEKRLRELPFAVQKEHEACSVDIVELQWHVSFKTRQETRIKAKLQLAESLNEKLKTELQYVCENDPKLSEKLQLESQVIVNLLQAHNTTATELMKTLKEQEKAEQESDKAEAKAEKERNYLKKEIDGVKKTLQKAKDDLNEAEKLHARYVQNVGDTFSFAKDTEEATKEQLEKLEKIKELEKMQEVKVRDLQEKCQDAQVENDRLKAEKTKVVRENEEAQNRRDQERVTLEAYVSNNERRFQTLTAENRNMKFENQDLDMQLEDNKASKEKDSKTLERLEKELRKGETEFEKVKENFHELDVQNKQFSIKLQDIEVRSKEKEDFLDQQIDHLNNQVRDEVSKRGQLQATISTEKGNLINLDLELQKQEEKMQKKAVEVESAVKKVTGQVEKMREKNEVRQKQLQELLNALEKLRGIHTETEAKLTDKKAKLRPKLEQLKADDLALSKQLDQMEHSSEALTGELREMKLGAIHLNRIIRTTRCSIEDLTSELTELKNKCRDKKNTIQSLEKSVEEAGQRLSASRESFKFLVTDRRNFHTRLQTELETRMKQNEQFASDYYTLRQKVFAAKIDFNKVYQQELELYQTLKNLHQVEFLQQKFFAALSEFFKYRYLFYETEVEDLRFEENQTEDKIQKIKQDIELALKVMSSFLDGMQEGSLLEDLKQLSMHDIEMELREAEKQEASANADEEIQSIVSQDDDNPVSELQGSSNLTSFKILPPIGSLTNIANTDGQPLLAAF